ETESVEGDYQVPVVLGQLVSPTFEARAPLASRRLKGEKPGSPAFGGDARPLGGDGSGGFSCEVPHDLPADGRIRIEEPFQVRGPRRVIFGTHWSSIASGVEIRLRAQRQKRGCGQP